MVIGPDTDSWKPHRLFEDIKKIAGRFGRPRRGTRDCRKPSSQTLAMHKMGERVCKINQAAAKGQRRCRCERAEEVSGQGGEPIAHIVQYLAGVKIRGRNVKQSASRAEENPPSRHPSVQSRLLSFPSPAPRLVLPPPRLRSQSSTTTP